MSGLIPLLNIPLASKSQSNFPFRISLIFWRPTFYYLELLRLPGVTQPSNSVKKEIKFKKNRVSYSGDHCSKGEDAHFRVANISHISVFNNRRNVND